TFSSLLHSNVFCLAPNRFSNSTPLPKERMLVYLGHTDLVPVNEEYLFEVAETIPHPGYVSVKQGNDIGLIKLARSIDFVKTHVRCLCHTLCEPLAPVAKVIGSRCYVVGWGTVDRLKPNQGSRKLMDARVPLFGESYCAKHLPSG